jgi:hypothetical protein
MQDKKTEEREPELEILVTKDPHAETKGVVELSLAGDQQFEFVHEPCEGSEITMETSEDGNSAKLTSTRPIDSVIASRKDDDLPDKVVIQTRTCKEHDLNIILVVAPKDTVVKVTRTSSYIHRPGHSTDDATAHVRHEMRMPVLIPMGGQLSQALGGLLANVFEGRRPGRGENPDQN